MAEAWGVRRRVPVGAQARRGVKLHQLEPSVAVRGLQHRERRPDAREPTMRSTQPPSTDPSPCVAYEGCDPATPVHYCQHPGDHVWPDFGSEAMWSFFQQQLE